RCRPSAAVPAIPVNAQPTEATVDSSTSVHGGFPPDSAVLMLIPAPRSCVAVIHRGCPPSGGITTLRAGFIRVNGTRRYAGALGGVRTLHKARLSVRGLSLK